MKGVKDYYNKTAGEWSDKLLKEKKESEILKKFYECFSLAKTKSPRILDMGSGAGYDSQILCSYGARVMGIDVSEKLVEIAKNKVKNAKFVVGDITEDLKSLGIFDGVVCLATLTFVEIQNLRQTFFNISQVLKKGGLLLVSSHEGVGKDLKESYIQIDGEDYDKNFNNYSAEELCGCAFPEFKLIDTWKFADFEEGWRYYVFIKK